MYDVTRVIWPYPIFSSITPDQIKLERREKHQCVQHELPNPMICNTTNPSSRYWPVQPWPYLGLRSTWNLTFPKQKVYHSTRLGKTNTMVSEFLLCEHFCRSYLLKTKPLHLCHWPDLWRHRLAWDLKFRYHSLRLVTLDRLVFFSEKL